MQGVDKRLHKNKREDDFPRVLAMYAISGHIVCVVGCVPWHNYIAGDMGLGRRFGCSLSIPSLPDSKRDRLDF